jgi:type II secretory pathway pseudopilin PulG
MSWEQRTGSTERGAAGFSLIEVTVAIGIFAFVAVGILGLLPAALKQRADSSRETRGVLIAEELFASVRAAGGITNIIIRDGPGLQSRNNRTLSNIVTKPAVLGYPAQTTVPFWSFDRNPESSWKNAGGSDGEVAESAANEIETLARLSVTNLTNNLYRVTVETRAPADIPLTNSSPLSFSTLIYLP